MPACCREGVTPTSLYVCRKKFAATTAQTVAFPLVVVSPVLYRIERMFVCELERMASGLDPDCMLLPDARALLDQLGRARRLIDGMVGRLARRIDDANEVAHTLGVPRGEVRSAVETAELLAELPATDAAVRRGELSAREARLIAGAAIVNTDAEEELLRTAKLGFVPLKDACVKARAAVEEPAARRSVSMRRGSSGCGPTTTEWSRVHSGSRPRSAERSKRSSRRSPEALSAAHVRHT